MRDFVYTANPGRVIFGAGSLARLGEEAERMGLERVLLLSTPQQEAAAQAAVAALGARCVGQFAGAVMHTPVGVTQEALQVATDLRADGIVAFGGGSTIGLGKAIALRTDLPQIAIPTTYAGSEMTLIIGETEHGRKVTQTTPKVLPETVIYDVELTLGLPAGLSGTSGINAIAHAVEALYAQNCNPVISLIAAEGVRALASALPRIAARPDDVAARSDAQYGAWLCGTCLGAVGMALHHKLCHTLGGTFDLPHAETHTVVLPHALAYNAPAAPEAVERLSAALGRDDPAGALFDLAGAVGAPRALHDLGMAETGIDKAADIAMANPYWNPRPLTRDGIRGVIARAWAGERPAAD
jgi:alcohol dehydrogenase class IV